MNDSRLDALLEACDPVGRSALETAGVQAALDELGAAVVSRRPARRRVLGRRRTLGLVAAAALAIGVAVAAGTVLSAHTGKFPPKSEIPMGGPGEELNPAAPDFRDVALQVASDIPFPAGYASWRELVISDESTDASDEVVSTGALHGWFAASAFCAWVRTWRAAEIAGDSEAASQATQMVSAAPGWAAVTAEDPHPSTSVPSDGGSTYSLFGWMLPYRTAVLAGDRARVDQLLASGYGGKCWTSDPGWRAELAAHGRDPGWQTLSQQTANYERFLASGGS
jgi:hypothetical protein